MLQGVLLDKALEVLFQRARDFGGAPGAGAVQEAGRALVGKAMDPFAQGRIGKLEGVGNRLEALPFDDVAHGLSTAEDARFFGLLEEGI